MVGPGSPFLLFIYKENTLKFDTSTNCFEINKREEDSERLKTLDLKLLSW